MSECSCKSYIHEQGCPHIEIERRLYGQSFFYALHSTSRRHTVKDELHPATEALLKHFTYQHLPPKLQRVSKPFCELAIDIAWNDDLNLDGPELTMALRKLLEAKDCAVRAAL